MTLGVELEAGPQVCAAWFEAQALSTEDRHGATSGVPGSVMWKRKVTCSSGSRD